MKNTRTLLMLLVSSLYSVALPAEQDGERAEVSALGALPIAEKYQINSRHLGETREFYLALPKTYENSDHHYPVLYLLDGDQNMEHAVASAQMLAEWRGIPELIVVGIPSTNRTRDYTPTKNADYSDQSGGGETFMRFVKQELVPYIDGNYRAHPFRILSGHSLSGLIAADDLMRASDVFDAYVITAPSLWWNGFEILDAAPQHFSQRQAQEKAAYFGIGEFDGFGMKQELLRYVSAIESSGNDSIRFRHKEYSGEGHMSAPMSVTYDGLLYVFSDIPYAKESWDDFSSEAFIAREARLRDKYGSTAVQTAENYVALAHYLLEQGKFAGAVTVFTAAAATNPSFAPHHDWLANAHVLAGDIPEAKAAYQKAYDLTVASINGQGNADQYLAQLELLNHPPEMGEAQLLAVAGCYGQGDESYALYLNDGTLHGRHKDWRDFELFPQTSERFFMRVPPGNHFRFVEDDAGKALLVESYGEESRLPKVEGDCR